MIQIFRHRRPLNSRGFLFILFLPIIMFSSGLDSLQLETMNNEIDSLLAIMVNDGFFDAKWNDSLISNEQYFINSIDYETTDSLISFDDKLSKSPLSGDLIFNSFLEIVTTYADNGFPFARINIIGFDRVDGKKSFDLHIAIKSGERVIVEDIYQKNPIKTRVLTIRKLMMLDVPNQYCMSNIMKGIERANRGGIIKLEQEHFVARDDQGFWYIAIRSKDISKSSAEGLVALTRMNGEIEAGGMLSANLVNLWGGARKFSLRWEKMQADKATLNIKAYDPFVFGSSIGLSLSFNQDTREYYTKRTFESGVEFPIAFTMTIPLNINFDWTNPDSVGLYSYNIPYSKGFGLSAGIRFNTLDNPNFPTSGLLVTSAVIGNRITKDAPADAISESLLDDEYIAEAKFRLTTIKYFGVVGPYFRLNAEGILITTSEQQSTTQMTYIGGFNTVRGHSEDEIYGERALWSGIEIRIRLDSKTAIFPFFDYGLTHSEQYNSIFGYGVGINTQTAIGMLQVNYGLSPERSFDEGLLHFGILREF